MTRTRYGITIRGLLGAGGAGLYLGIIPGGLLTLLGAAARVPHELTIIPIGIVLGALAGPVAAFVTRRAIAPAMPRRYLRFTLAMAATMPFYLAIGIAPRVLGDQASTAFVGLALLGGIAATITYYQWRKRLTLQRRVRRTTAPSPNQA